MPRLHLSPALVVALLALVVALGGTAYAAGLLTGRDIKDGSLTGRDVANGSLGGQDVRAGAGLKLRYIATSYFQDGRTQASGDAVCPRGMYAVGGGVSGFGDDRGNSNPGEQLVNAAFPYDGRDRDRVPERFIGFVYNASAKRLNFEVDAVCANAAAVSSNFARSAGIARVRSLLRRSVRATRVR